MHRYTALPPPPFPLLPSPHYFSLSASICVCIWQVHHDTERVPWCPQRQHSHKMSASRPAVRGRGALGESWDCTPGSQKRQHPCGPFAQNRLEGIVLVLWISDLNDMQDLSIRQSPVHGCHSFLDQHYNFTALLFGTMDQWRQKLNSCLFRIQAFKHSLC